MQLHGKRQLCMLYAWACVRGIPPHLSHTPHPHCSPPFHTPHSRCSTASGRAYLHPSLSKRLQPINPPARDGFRTKRPTPHPGHLRGSTAAASSAPSLPASPPPAAPVVGSGARKKCGPSTSSSTLKTSVMLIVAMPLMSFEKGPQKDNMTSRHSRRPPAHADTLLLLLSHWRFHTQ
eukprot:359761-Chlamydomonas_euryale.AAC.3